MRPRSPAVEELREFCNARNSERTFRLFEVYDLEGHEKISYEATGKDYAIAVTDVTNALADGHMHNATYTFLDNDHFKTTWTFRRIRRMPLPKT